MVLAKECSTQEVNDAARKRYLLEYAASLVYWAPLQQAHRTPPWPWPLNINHSTARAASRSRRHTRYEGWLNRLGYVQAVVAVFSSGSTDGQEAVVEDRRHFRSFNLPVILIILYDAKRIYP